MRQMEFFTNVLQIKKANVENFILAVRLEKIYTNEVYNLGMQLYYNQWHLISHLLTS